MGGSKNIHFEYQADCAKFINRKLSTHPNTSQLLKDDAMYHAAERYFRALLPRAEGRGRTRLNATDLREVNRYEGYEHPVRWNAPPFWRI
ncbi:hypothetical protein [Sagittula sp.]